MPGTYRAYILGADGHFKNVHELPHCISDGEATEAAEAIVQGHGLELWRGERLVTRLPPRFEVSAPTQG
jgi:hypothetical protein